MIACDCPVCRSGDPRNRRFRCHLHVEAAGLNVQVDAAPEFRLQAIRHGIPKVDLILLTHGHADHILGMDDMRRYCDGRDGEALPVYSSEEGMRRMREIYPYAIRDRPATRGYPAFRLAPMPSVLELPGLAIRSTRQSHGGYETLGLVFEERATGARFAYYTDCDSVTPEAEALAAGADALALDGLRFRPHPSHLSIDGAVEAARRIGARRTYLVHMTHEIDHETVDARLPEGISLAYDNLVLEL